MTQIFLLWMFKWFNEVLKGFGKKLKDVQFIYTEVNRDYLCENNVLVNDLDAFLKSQNFLRVWTSWRRADMLGDVFYMNLKNRKI